MPYQSNAALPQAVRDKYDADGQEAFRKAWMSAHAEGKTEAECFAIAHAAAEKVDSKAAEAKEPPDAPMRASYDAVELLQAEGSFSAPGSDEWVFPAVMIRAGFSAISIPGLPEKLRGLPVYVTPEFIAKSPAHFDGSPAYLGHQTSSEGRVRALFGGWKNVRAEGPELKGELHVLKTEGTMRDKLAAAIAAGLPIGLSFQALAGYQAEKREGRNVMAVTDPLPLPKVPRSVDVVMYPAADGHFLPIAAEGELAAALEAARKQFLKTSPAPGRNNPSSAERSDSKGATVKKSILNMLVSLRSIASLGEPAKTEIAAIEAECNADNVNYEGLLERTEKLLTGATAAIPASATPQAVASISAEVTALKARVDEAQSAQRVAEFGLLLNQKLTASKLPVAAQNRIRKRLQATVITAEALDTEIAADREMLAAIVPGPHRVGHVAASVILDPSDKLGIALDRLCGVTHHYTEVHEGRMIHMVKADAVDKTVPAFDTLPEAIREWSGGLEGVWENFGMVRAGTEFSSTSLPLALADSLHRRLLQRYAEVDYGIGRLVPYGQPHRIPLEDFKLHHFVRVGEFGDIDVVDPESGDYQPITVPTDEEVTMTLNQHGNTCFITRKAMINDDIGALTANVDRLARAARRTFARAVMTLITGNGTIYDGLTLFHANHNNSGTTALTTGAVYETIRAAMFAQTEPFSGEVLGVQNEPFTLMVPSALFGKARIENEREYLGDATPMNLPNVGRHIFGQNSENIQKQPLMVDANDYYVFANPSDVPTFVLGFYNGREDPEFFLQDNPLVGVPFNSDKIVYKLRHEYVAAIQNFRGVYAEINT